MAGAHGVRLRVTVALAAAALAGGPALAQDGPVARPTAPGIEPEFAPVAPMAEPSGPGAGFLFINQERILTGSQAGQALLRQEEDDRDQLRAEARALDAAFEEEERRLTEQRDTLAADEFRKLSDDFDARVVQARRDQDNRSAALAQEFDQRRRQFYARVAPILVMLMDSYGARAIFDENSVLLADESLNITDAVIAEIDAHAAAPAPGGGPDEAAEDPAAPGETDEGE